MKTGTIICLLILYCHEVNSMEKYINKYNTTKNGDPIYYTYKQIKTKLYKQCSNTVLLFNFFGVNI